MTGFSNVPTQGWAQTMHSEDAVAGLWAGEFHFASKGSVPITNQSIPWTLELTQLQCDTLQLQSKGNTAGCLQPMLPLTGVTTAPPCTMRRAHTPTAAARLDPGSVQPETHSVVQSRKTSLVPAQSGPIMNSDQAAQGCLNSWSPPWEAVQCGTEHDKPQDKRYPGFQPCLPLHTGCTATPFYKATVHNHYQNIPCSTLLHKHYVKEKDIMSQLKSIIICMDLSNTFDLSSSLQQR